MRTQYTITDEAIGIAREEQERVEELDEKGLCLHCGDNPQNPHIGGRVCLECYRSHDQVGCQAAKCPNSSDGTFKGMAFCKVHLVDCVYSAYEDYLSEKEELESWKAKFNKRVDEVGTHPRNMEKPPREMTEEESDLYDEFAQIKYYTTNLNSMKRDIKDVIEGDIQVFPEGYKVFG